MTRTYETIDRAVAEIRRGRMVVVVDDEDRENEGDLVIAAELAAPADLAFMIRHTSGIVCVGITAQRASELDLGPMVEHDTDPRGTAFTVTVDAAAGTSTGVSAADRTATVRVLAEQGAGPRDLFRPGHVFPLVAREGGVLERTGHTESAVDLCRLAGLAPAGVLAEITNDDGTMARRPDLERFAAEHDLVMITVSELVRYRRAAAGIAVRCTSTARVPTRAGEFTAHTFVAEDGVEHVAFVLGEVDEVDDRPVPVRLHSECLSGDVFGSRRCDCGEQLDLAMRRIADAGRGAVVYLRGHEGRGIGLARKFQAYALQDDGLDTVDANVALGLPVDDRDYRSGAAILMALGVRRIELMSNNPAKDRAMSACGIAVAARSALRVDPNPDNVTYLAAKQRRMGHELEIAT